MADSQKKKTRAEEESTKFEYVENEKNFFSKIKSIFHIFKSYFFKWTILK